MKVDTWVFFENTGYTQKNGVVVTPTEHQLW
jgi:hypothetical protein